MNYKSSATQWKGEVELKSNTMKKLVCIMLFSVFFCFENMAQKTQMEEPLSNKSTIKGKRELKREMRIHNAAGSKLAKQNERRARKEHKLGTVSNHDSKAKKLAKDRKKAKLKDEKMQAKKNREEQIRNEKEEPLENSKG